MKLALTHRSYLSVTGQGPRESNERLEFLGDSVLGLVTSEYLYRENPDEHEGQLTKTKSLLVSKAILSRRALAMGLGRFVLMSHSEVESGGRQRLSILADAFESVLGAIYLDQGFEAARTFIHRWLLKDMGAIVADKRHTNFKSHLQEYVQSTYRTHPIYRIRSEYGPDHSKLFNVEVVVGKRVLGGGKGRNKKEAEQAAARDALDNVGGKRSAASTTATPVSDRPPGRTRERASAGRAESPAPAADSSRRRSGRGRETARDPEAASAPPARDERPTTRDDPPTPRDDRPRGRRLVLPREPEYAPAPPEVEPPPPYAYDDEEIGRPDGSHEELHVDPYAMQSDPSPGLARPTEEAVDRPLAPPSGGEKAQPGRASSFGRRGSRRR